MLVVLQRFGEAELHPPSLGHKAQCTVSADVVKPSAVEGILHLQGPLSICDGLRKRDVRQDCAWRGVLIPGRQRRRRQGPAAEVQGKPFVGLTFPSHESLSRSCEWQSQSCLQVPLTKHRSLN